MSVVPQPERIYGPLEPHDPGTPPVIGMPEFDAPPVGLDCVTCVDHPELILMTVRPFFGMQNVVFFILFCPRCERQYQWASGWDNTKVAEHLGRER